jgi:predicted XRE-type DNA-binding protein
MRAKRSRSAVAVTHGTGNVFADLGLPDAEEHRAKYELVRILRGVVEGRGWTQREAASRLGARQPDVSDLFRGKLARFSRERIERFLVALDMDVAIRVGPKPRGRERGRLVVEAVEG